MGGHGSNYRNKLLQCLGSFNPALEVLTIWRDYEDGANDNILTREQNQSLQCLSNGCPLLKEIYLLGCKLSTSDISYLVNHFIHLEKLTLTYCKICDDGLIISKVTDKLKYLKKLSLFRNSNIIDESIINLVKGCHNLKDIDIEKCTKLTDTSLFSIAANCPNLKKIYLDFRYINRTEEGLAELLTNCPQLVEIEPGWDRSISNEIKSELKRRKMLMKA